MGPVGPVLDWLEAVCAEISQAGSPGGPVLALPGGEILPICCSRRLVQELVEQLISLHIRGAADQLYLQAGRLGRREGWGESSDGGQGAAASRIPAASSSPASFRILEMSPSSVSVVSP